MKHYIQIVLQIQRVWYTREDINRKYKSTTNTPTTGLLPATTNNFFHPLPFFCYVVEGGVCSSIEIFDDFSSSILNSLYKYCCDLLEKLTSPNNM